MEEKTKQKKEEEMCECGHTRWFHIKDKLNDGRCGCCEYNFELGRNHPNWKTECSCKKFKLKKEVRNSSQA